MAFHLRCYVVGSKLRSHQVSLIDFGKAKVAQLHWSILWKRQTNDVNINDTFLFEVDLEVLGYVRFRSSQIRGRYDILNTQAVNGFIPDVMQLIQAEKSAEARSR